MLSLIKKSCDKLDSEGNSIEVGLKEIIKIDEKDLKSIKCKKGKIQEISTKTDRDGYMIYDSQMKKSSYVSLNYYLDNIKKSNRLKIFNLLSDGGEKL